MNEKLAEGTVIDCYHVQIVTESNYTGNRACDDELIVLDVEFSWFENKSGDGQLPALAEITPSPGECPNLSMGQPCTLSLQGQ